MKIIYTKNPEMESKSFQKRPAKDDVMRIERVELALLRLPYVHFFEMSFGREYGRTFVIAKVYADGLCGFGEQVDMVIHQAIMVNVNSMVSFKLEKQIQVVLFISIFPKYFLFIVASDHNMERVVIRDNPSRPWHSCFYSL